MKRLALICVALLLCRGVCAQDDSGQAPAVDQAAVQTIPMPSGNPADVLRSLSASYETRVTDEASRAALEEQRSTMLETIATDRAFAMGAETRDVTAIQATYERTVALQDELTLGVNIPNDLSPLHYLNFVIVTADSSDGGSAGFMSAATEKNHGALLDKADPMVVAAVLFLARKGQVKLTAARVLQRWEKNPLHWNPICTEQALLFIAKQGPSAFNTLKPKTPEVQKELRRLVQVPWGTCQAQMLFFAREGKPHSKMDIRVPRAGTIMISSAAQKTWLDAKSSSAGVVEIRSGRWLLKSIDGVASGESKPVEHKQGTFFRLMIPFVKGSL